MKKFFTFILALCAMALSVNAQSTIIAEKIPGYCKLGMLVKSDGSAEYHPVFYDVNWETGVFEAYIYENGLTTPKIVRFTNVDDYVDFDDIYCDAYEAIATKNWFIKNDKWCFILCFKTDEKDELYEYLIVDEDGNKHGKFSDLLPKLGDGYSSSMRLMLDGVTYGRPYLIASYYPDDSSNEEKKTIIEFTGEGSVKAVPVAQLSAYPNPLRGGQTFTVEFDRVADANTVLVVTDMNGRQVLRKKVEVGAEKATLRHGRLSGGQYIYTVIFGDGTSASGKLLSE